MEKSANQKNASRFESYRFIDYVSNHYESIFEQFFYHELESALIKCPFITLSAKESNLLDFWKIKVNINSNGAVSDLIDIFYCFDCSEKNTILAGRGDVIYFLLSQLPEKCKDDCLVNKYCDKANAADYRDRVILSYRLKSFICERNDSGIDFSPYYNPESVYISIGDTTIINWGCIIEDMAFHDENAIYPLGFKCIRQLYDIYNDCIVDCLCEVDAFVKDSYGNFFKYSCASDQQLDRNCNEILSPIFRISVQWQNAKLNTPYVKVYESYSPHLAWQSALTEDVTNVFDDSKKLALNEDDIESEEDSSRLFLDQSRRSLFYLLKKAQQYGEIGSVIPRLSLKNIYSFVDDSVQRLIEGMPGSELCKRYQFLDSRNSLLVPNKTMKTKLWQECIESFDSVLSLEAIIARQDTSELSTKLQLDDASIFSFDSEGEKTYSEGGNEMGMSRSKDFEHSISQIRSNYHKVLKSRREDVKCLLESIVLKEVSDSEDCGDYNTLLLTEGSSRPLAPLSIEHSSGVLSSVVKIWSFLNFCSKCGRLPVNVSLNEITDSLKYQTDKALLITKALETAGFPNIGYKAESLLNRIGKNLVSLLKAEYERILGCDIIASDDSFPLNIYTWKEPARILILQKLGELVGLSQNDLSGLVKGRSFSFIPEFYDRKALKLSRKRIISLSITQNGFPPSGLNSVVGQDIDGNLNPTWVEIALLLSKIDNESDYWLLQPILTSSLKSFLLMPESLYSNQIREEIISTLSVKGDIDSVRYIETCQNVFSLLNKLSVDVSKDSLLMTSFDDTISNILPDEEPLSLFAECNLSKTGMLELLVMPELMHKCLEVLKILMANPLSEPFLDPVDSASMPSYFKVIPRPFSLSEIKRRIEQGIYENKISRFYTDVRFVLENSYAFNSENSDIRASTNKIDSIFEALFLDMVLELNHNPPSIDCCRFCHRSDQMAASKVAICDRCDSKYHIFCVNPPLKQAPRSDWFCQRCSEQRGVEDIHPFSNATVAHPQISSIVGKVVNVRQINRKIQFDVVFPNFRLVWSWNEVYKNLHDERVSGLLKRIEDFEDYNYVCGLARGYSGWRDTCYKIPPVFLDSHFANAADSAKNNPDFSVLRKALILLSDAGAVDRDWNIDNWICVFEALIIVVMDVVDFQTSLPSVEEQRSRLSTLLQNLDPLKSEGQRSHDCPSSKDLLSTSSMADFDNSSLENYFSRLKGREDALQSAGLIWEVAKGIDTSSACPQDGIPEHLMKVIVGAIKQRPPESVVAEEWLSAWNFQSNCNDNLQDETLCSFCGTSEIFLGSPMVLAKSYKEWITENDAAKESGGKVSRRSWKFLKDDNLDSPCHVSGGGSIIAHEFCASHLCNYRHQIISSSPELAFEKVIEVLPRLILGMTSYIGKDTENNTYWYFHGVDAIFVQSLNTKGQAVWEMFDYCKISLLVDWLKLDRRNHRIWRAINCLEISSSSLNKSSMRDEPDFIAGKALLKVNSGLNLNIPKLAANNVGSFFSIDETVSLGSFKVKIIEIKEISSCSFEKERFYNVRFCDILSEDRWFSSLHFGNDAHDVRPHPVSEILRGLNAFKFLYAAGRATSFAKYLKLSLVTSSSIVLNSLRCCLIAILAAIPSGSLDSNEDKWGSDFSATFLTSLFQASEPSMFMQCIIVLEYGLRQAWLRPEIAKFLTFLPSRLQSLKHATFSNVFLRLHILDAAIRYEKLQ